MEKLANHLGRAAALLGLLSSLVLPLAGGAEESGESAPSLPKLYTTTKDFDPFLKPCFACLSESGVPGAPPPPPPPPVTYEQCDASKNYLNRSLAAYLNFGSPPPVALERCVLEGLLRAPEAGMPKAAPTEYAQCSSATAVNEKFPRPCASRELVQANARSLQRVAACTSLSPRFLLALVNHESRLYPNIKSEGGVWGTTMLTGPTIKSVNAQLMDKPFFPKRNPNGEIVKVKLAELDTPGCEAIRAAANEENRLKDNDCSRISTPANPLYAMIYATIVLYDNLEHAQSAVADWKNLPPALAGPIAGELALVSYNGGWPRVIAAFNSYRKKAKIPKDFASFRKGFSAHLLAHYNDKKKSKKKEVSEYSAKTADDLARVEKAAGGSCGL